ncbi:MAG: hypothetical protein IJJ33_13070 [Victivallales bacterium]|nr:hypothetical protein [Victivallales bacterium]
MGLNGVTVSNQPIIQNGPSGFSNVQGLPSPGNTQETNVSRPGEGTQSPAVQMAGSLTGVAEARADAAQREAAPNKGLFGCIKAGLARFAAAVKSMFTRAPAQPQPTIPAHLAVNCSIARGRMATVRIDQSQYEQMVLSLPKGERPAAIQNLQTTLEGRINRGIDLLNQVRGGTCNETATAQNVSDLMLGLYALAAAQGDAFTNGAFQVADPDGNLAAWLDKSPEVYLRSSSHLKAYQGEMVDGHVNMQRGIDIPEGDRTGLPNGHKTLAYGVIPGHAADPATGLAETPRRIFLKTESAGCRISTSSFSSNKGALSQGMQVRGVRISDIPEAIKHGLSFLQTRGKQGAGGSRKEHFPSAVSNAYKTAVDSLKTLSKNSEVGQLARDTLKMLERGKPASGGGLCRLRENIAGIRSAVFQGKVSSELKAVIDNLERVCNDPNIVRADHPTIRLGNEVIID